MRLDDAGIAEAKNGADKTDGDGDGGGDGDGDGLIWKRFVAEDGRPYYFREDTGERVWTLPGAQSTKHAEPKKCVLL